MKFPVLQITFSEPDGARKSDKWLQLLFGILPLLFLLDSQLTHILFAREERTHPIVLAFLPVSGAAIFSIGVVFVGIGIVLIPRPFTARRMLFLALICLTCALALFYETSRCYRQQMEGVLNRTDERIKDLQRLEKRYKDRIKELDDPSLKPQGHVDDL